MFIAYFYFLIFTIFLKYADDKHFTDRSNVLDDPKGRTYLLLSEMKYYLSTSFVRNFMFLANETSIKYAF